MFLTLPLRPFSVLHALSALIFAQETTYVPHTSMRCNRGTSVQIFNISVNKDALRYYATRGFTASPMFHFLIYKTHLDKRTSTASFQSRPRSNGLGTWDYPPWLQNPPMMSMGQWGFPCQPGTLGVHCCLTHFGNAWLFVVVEHFYANDLLMNHFLSCELCKMIPVSRLKPHVCFAGKSLNFGTPTIVGLDLHFLTKSLHVLSFGVQMSGSTSSIPSMFNKSRGLLDLTVMSYISQLLPFICF